ncbi:MAG: HAD-IA family hydrolase [Actinomycetota bacterium]
MSPDYGLLLDCDGTIADTERDGHLVAFNRAFADLGYDITWSVEEYRELLDIPGGKERLRAYVARHPELGLGSGDELEEHVLALHRRKSEVYLELVDAGALPGRPGVRRLVHAALDEGWRVAVASTSSARSVEAVTRSVVGDEAVERMSGVFAGDIVEHKKPHPAIYELALSDAGLDRSRTIVVEDSRPGATAAQRAGLTHLVTVSHFTRDEHFPDAATVVDSLGEPGEPATLLAGVDARNDEGFHDLASLRRLLGA